MNCHFNLSQITKVPIERHVKIRSAATPFDPQYQEYLEKRKSKRLARNSWTNLIRLLYKLLGIKRCLCGGLSRMQ
ncbi:hypothetical protein VCHA36P168_160074 [Vibrio chagasii]|nr:hypothetical protein VCHA36P168_160074 [Vibrio chagasii]